MNWFLRQYLLALVLVSLWAIPATSFAQCGDSIDLGTWIQEGVPAHGNWVVSGGGNAVNQTINGDPTFYVSPDSFLNVIITGDIRVTTANDDDWVGFVFGYQDPDTTDPNNYDFYLFDWKQNDQNFGGFFGQEGFALSKLDGPVVSFPQAFSSKTSPSVNVLASQFGNNEGWNDLQTYSFALTYTNTRTVISIDGDTIFDLFGCFPPGRFGFYNFSQSDVEYSNFSYRVAAAFDVLTPNVCLGDSARFIALSDSCTNAAGVPVNNTLTNWFWDFGDGSTSNDTNGTHYYNNPGTYQVSLEVTDYLGCKDTAYSTVQVYDVVTDLGNDTSVCTGDFITLDADTNATSYLWSTGEITQTINVTLPDTYSVTVTGGGGCSDTDSVIVTNIALPIVDIGNDTSICNADSTTLFAGNPGAAFLWNDSSTLDSLVVNDSGTYWVEVTYPSGCSNRDSTIITKYAQPVVSPPNPSLCYGDTVTITATGANTYTWLPAAGLSNTVGDTVKTFTLVDTTYSVVGIDTNGCTDTSVFYVDVLDLPTASIFGEDSVCNGDSLPLYLALTGTGPWDVSYRVNGDTFYRNNIQTPNDTFIVADSGMYTLLVVSDAQCSNSTNDSAYVYWRPDPIISFNSPTDSICIGDTVTITAQGGIAYSWIPGTGLNDSLAGTVQAYPQTTTNYTVAGQDQYGCRDTSDFLLEVLPLPTLNLSATPNPVCSLDTTVFEATGAQSYTWVSSLTLDTLTGDSFEFIPTEPVAFGVYALDQYGCANDDSLYLVVDTLPELHAFPSDTVFCIEDSAQLQMQGANFYTWNTLTGLSDSTIANPVASPSDTTVYHVRGENLNGCISYDTVTVNIWSLPIVSILADTNEICFEDTLNLTGSGATIYNWQPNYNLTDTLDTIVGAFPEVDTSYSVIGTDTNGCRNVDTFSIIVHPLPEITLTTPADSICRNDTTVLEAAGAVTYAWDSDPGLNAYTGDSVLALPQTTTQFRVYGTDIEGCVNFNDTIVRVLNLPNIIVQPNSSAICFGETQQLSVPQQYNYAWSPMDSVITDGNNADTVNAFPGDTTIYTIGATDFFGCFSDTHYTVNVTPLPVISTSVEDSVICPGDSTILHVTGSYDFLWGPPPYILNTQTANPTVLPTTSDRYYVTATGPGGCQSTDSVDVAVYEIGDYSAGVDTTVCQEDTVQLEAYGGVSYKWSPQIGLTDTSIANPLCFTLANRWYYVEMIDSNGCEIDDAVFVTVFDLPTARAGRDDTICFGDSVIIGGNPSNSSGTTLQWSPSIGLNSSTTPNPIATPDTSTTYNLLVTDGNGCQDESSTRVEVRSLPVLETVGLPPYACAGDTFRMDVTPGLETYQWIPEDLLDQSDVSDPMASPKDTTTFEVSASDKFGCTSHIEFTLPVAPKPMVRILGSYEMCVGDTLNMVSEASKGDLQWEPAEFFDDPTILTPKAFPPNLMDLKLNITDDLGCKNKSEKLVFVHELPIADAGEDQSNCNMNVIYLGGDVPTTEENEWTWSPGEKLDNPRALNPKVLSIDTDTFYLEVISPEGCFNQDTVVINSNCYIHLYAPNSFTPDGDNLNETFVVKGENIFNTHMTIYDRFGHLIFQTRDMLQGWDGSYQNDGKPAPIGTYFWRLTFATRTGRVLSDEGFVNLLR